MLIALLIALGIDVIVIIGIGGTVISRRQWLRRQPGEFTGAIRLQSGDVDGLGHKWKRGSGRWVRDVLIWNHAPFMFRSTVLGVDHLVAERPAPETMKRLGDHPVLAEFECGPAVVQVAVRIEDRMLLAAPWPDSAEAGPSG